jgi:acyl transferase domain-containing protein
MVNGDMDPKTIPQKLLVFSAADSNGISRLIKAYSQFFSGSEIALTAESLNEVAFTLNARRTLLPWKSYAVVSPSSLTNLKQLTSKPVRAASNLRLGFVFTGQGAQWFAMGRELLDCSEVFRESLRRSQISLDALGCEWSLLC